VAWSWHNRRQLTLPGGGRLQLRADRHGEVAVARLPPRLELRFRAGGERLPTSAGRRALKNLLQQRRIPPWLRMHLPLLCIAERIIAVPGVWVAPEIAARAGETRRARLVWQPPPEDAA
jgi:tRNA(Ile)-lysidine synthase